MRLICKTICIVAAVAMGVFTLASCTDEESHNYGVDDLTGVLTFYDLEDVRNMATNEEITAYMQGKGYIGILYSFGKTEDFSLLSQNSSLQVAYEFFASAQTNAKLMIKWLNLSTVNALVERRLPEIAHVMDGHTFRHAELNGTTYSNLESVLEDFKKIDFATYTNTQIAMDIYYEDVCVTVLVQTLGGAQGNGDYHLKYQINHM